METKTSTFQERLAEALKLRSMRPHDLAVLTGISPTNISYYLSGKRKNVKADTVQKLARGLNVSEAWLIGYGNDPMPTSKVDRELQAQTLHLVMTLSDAQLRKVVIFINEILLK